MFIIERYKVIIGNVLLMASRISIPWAFHGYTTVTGANPIANITGLSVVAGDLIILVAAAATVGLYSTPPTGFTLAASDSDGLAPASALFYKVATGGDSNVQITGVNSSTEVVHALRYSNISNAAPLNSVGTNTRGSTSPATNPGTSTTINGLVVAIFALNTVGSGSGGSISTISGMNQRVNLAPTNTVMGLSVSDVSDLNGGNYVPANITASGVSYNWNYRLFCFNPEYP